MTDKETKGYKLVVCMDCGRIITTKPSSRIKYCSECRGKRIAAGINTRKRGEQNRCLM